MSLRDWWFNWVCFLCQICAAIKDGFNDTRSVLEPAGALAIAGMKKMMSGETKRQPDSREGFIRKHPEGDTGNTYVRHSAPVSHQSRLGKRGLENP